MSKKNVKRCAAAVFGAVLFAMAAAMPVFAEPETTAETAETAADEAAVTTAPAEDPDSTDTSTRTTGFMENTRPITTEPPYEPDNPVAGLEYEETDDGGIRITKYKWTSAKHVEVPAEIDGKPVTEIGEECFKYCYCDTVSLPDTIVKIDERAFMFCAYVQEITIPPHCEYIGTHAFDSCERLKTINLPESLTFIGFSAFDDTPFNETLTDKFVILGDHLLYRYNEDESEVTIPDGVKYIGEYAFEFKKLKSVKIPDSVKEIYEFAFEGCDDLAKIDVPENIEAIAPNAVANTKWQLDSKDEFIVLGKILLNYTGDENEVTVPDGIRVISRQVFNFCENLMTVHLPDSVEIIGEGAFARCPQLQIVELGENVQVIGRKAFESCRLLSYVRFGHQLREIGEDAFLECYKLESAYLPDTVETVRSHAFGYQFGDDADTYLKMNTPLKLYANSEAVRAYAEEAGIEHAPLPDEENTKPELSISTEADAKEKIGKPIGKAWIPAAILGGILVLVGGAAAVMQKKRSKD